MHSLTRPRDRQLYCWRLWVDTFNRNSSTPFARIHMGGQISPRFTPWCRVWTPPRYRLGVPQQRPTSQPQSKFVTFSNEHFAIPIKVFKAEAQCSASASVSSFLQKHSFQILHLHTSHGRADFTLARALVPSLTPPWYRLAFAGAGDIKTPRLIFKIHNNST